MLLFSCSSALSVMLGSFRGGFGAVSEYYYPRFSVRRFLDFTSRFLPNKIHSAFRMGRQVLSRDSIYRCNKFQKTKFNFSLIFSDWSLLILYTFSSNTTFIWKKRWKPSVLPWPSVFYLKLCQGTFFMILLFIPIGVGRVCVVHLLSLGKFCSGFRYIL